MIRVLLVDDQALMRAGFRALLDAEDDLEVVGEASDGAAAVQSARRLRPDVVLMDVQMPGLDGIEATRRIAADPALSGVRVLILTNYGLDSYVFAALRAGASGFLLKDADPADLLRAVAVISRGDALLAPAVTRTLISEFVTAPPLADPAAGRDRLTAREQEIVELVARGLSNDELAERMVISPLTVKTHVNRAMMKLHARDRAQLVVFAYESGLVGG
jgi:DNA-binding NarL/FixJ family response regulator